MDDAFNNDPSWQRAPLLPKLEIGEVHLWSAELDQSATAVDGFSQQLSVDERERADRLVFPRDRDLYIVARGILRNILARYLDTHSARLRFRYNSFGKPFLVSEPEAPPLCFNLSHSHRVGLFAVALDREVGVDVEYVRENVNAMDIAGRFFSKGEIEALLSLPDDLQTRAFFNCWTRKEAYIKAIGLGLSSRLEDFDVSLLPTEPARLLRVAGDRSAVTRWKMQEISIGPDYAATLAVQGNDWSLSCWKWDAQ